MIIVDENVDQRIVLKLFDQGFVIYSIRNNHPGISDKKIIEIARLKEAIIVTEDKDFGELVFAHKIESGSVIFLRYKRSDLDAIANKLILSIKKYDNSRVQHFITITGKQVRVRKI